jgi:hypothetical protein
MWKILDKKVRQPCYGGNKQGAALRVLVIGAGPCGLRCRVGCCSYSLNQGRVQRHPIDSL